MAKHIKESIPELFRILMNEYGIVAMNNPIARFNLERLYRTYSEINPVNNRIL